MRTIFLFLLIVAGISAPAQSLSEEQKIQNLIVYMENLDKAVFIRNGKEYNSKQAGKFLREKWRRNADKVKTAKDFIVYCGSISSTSGKPYQVKFENGKLVNSQELLVKELVRIEEKCAVQSKK